MMLGYLFACIHIYHITFFRKQVFVKEGIKITLTYKANSCRVFFLCSVKLIFFSYFSHFRFFKFAYWKK